MINSRIKSSFGLFKIGSPLHLNIPYLISRIYLKNILKFPIQCKSKTESVDIGDMLSLL